MNTRSLITVSKQIFILFIFLLTHYFFKIKTGQNGGDYTEYTAFISDTEFVRVLISTISLIISKTAPQTYRLRKQLRKQI